MFELAGGFFENIRKIDKAYRIYFQKKLAAYQFTPNEIVVIMFLYNNAPAMDTATDIVRCKGISKGLVARSVDLLCGKGYLEAVRDEGDRRVIHLRINSSHGTLMQEIKEAQQEMEQEILKNIPKEHLDITRDTLNQLLHNTEPLSKQMGEGLRLQREGQKTKEP